MARCPVCNSVRVVLMVAPSPRAFCAKCGSRWTQEGTRQHTVERGPVAREAAQDTPA